MKILYISPENTVGTMTLWKEIHQKNGNECEVLTMYRMITFIIFEPDKKQKGVI